MSNQIYDDKFFNEEIKNEFVKEKWGNKDDSRSGFFRKSGKLEREFKKDIYEFNKDELKELLYALNASTESSFRSQLSTITNYLDWSIEKGYRNEENSLPQYADGEYGKYIKKKKGKYITFDRLVKGTKPIVNAQDKVIPLLLWYGISGINSSELTNLKIKDIDVNRKRIRVYEEIGENRETGDFRIVNIDDYTAQVVDDAIKQIYYEKSNGKMKRTERTTIPDKAVLAQTGYLIKAVDTNIDVFGAVEHNVIAKRFDLFKSVADLPNVTPTTITHSKHITDAWEVKKKKGKLTDEDLMEIAEKNGVKPIKFNGKVQINMHRFKPYITDENFEELYGE